ncbi:ABC transporter ATP-binding protein [Micromonospora chokoriensis]|uniref:ABC transporter ATP-binding protein n=1 Tax=Micromonospora chokoriensis TaxID=356851 RepID=UPI0004C2E9A8|nr:oligopeptide/dipeptide ABC transporter ATP-binding protein [Micromonospora chokoriensis]
MSENILEVRDLVKHYPVTQGVVFKKTVGQVKAVDGVSFGLRAGETLGVVGESGCGKSTLARVLMNLEKPTEGSVVYKGQDISTLSGGALRRLRRQIQLVMQDPYTSLNPRMTVGDLLGEPFEIHPEVAPKGSRRAKVRELLDLVGLNPEHINRYPHQFSGGQRQRIGIARALALEQLQGEFGLSYVFIAHDLSVVRHLSDRVAVMYLGKIVEIGTEDEIYERPTHPYTQALLSAVPVPDPTQRNNKTIIRLTGDVPSPISPPSGCRFRTRCWKAQDVCAEQVPLLEIRQGSDHPSACHFAEKREIVATHEV